MEPRWQEEWKDLDRSKKDRVVFLGGTNEFDLWFDGAMDMRVAWGETSSKWDWFFWDRDAEKYKWGSEDYLGANHPEVLVDALAYLRIFAPWVEEEMKKGEQDYHGTPLG